MRHLLLVQVKSDAIGPIYRIVFSGGYGPDSYDLCLAQSSELSDEITWMIVAEKRAHSGTETLTY